MRNSALSLSPVVHQWEPVCDSRQMSVPCVYPLPYTILAGSPLTSNTVLSVHALSIFPQLPSHSLASLSIHLSFPFFTSASMCIFPFLCFRITCSVLHFLTPLHNLSPHSLTSLSLHIFHILPSFLLLTGHGMVRECLIAVLVFMYYQSFHGL